MTDTTPEHVDLAERITSRIADRSYVEALIQRYRSTYVGPPDADGPPAILLDGDTWNFVFSAMCDAASQLLFADTYNIDPDDEMFHTSNPARQVARVLMEAAGLTDPDHQLAMLPPNDEDLDDEEAMRGAALDAYPDRSAAWRSIWAARMKHYVEHDGDMTAAPEFTES